MKRAARKQREQEREEKAAAKRREREEIFEVGEEGMSLEALADAIQVDPSDIMRTLFMKGIMLSMNQVRCYFVLSFRAHVWLCMLLVGAGQKHLQAGSSSI